MIDKEDIYKSIAEALYDKGIIDQDLYRKCTKEHISILPYDLRTTDPVKLQKRYDTLNKKIKKLESQMYSSNGNNVVFLNENDMRYKYVKKHHQELDKTVFEKSKTMIKQATTLSKKLDKLISNAEVESVSEKEERWAVGLDEPHQLFGGEKLIHEAREKLTRQTNHTAMIKNINDLKKTLSEFDAPKLKNQDGNRNASDLTWKLRSITGSLRNIKDRNANPNVIGNLNIPVDPIIELPPNLDKVLDRLSKYNADLNYENKKIYIDSQKEYWDAQQKLLDYRKQRDKVERKARDNNIVLVNNEE